MAVRTGDMRFEVTILQRSTVQDDAGEPAASWSTFASRRAAIQRTPGSEVFAAAQRNGRVPLVFRLRYLAGVTPAMRIQFDGKLHNIVSAIDPSGRKEELVITAEELVGVSA